MNTNVLVIDDESTLLWSLCRLLRGWGAEVHCASSTTAGLGVLNKYTFDVVLLDFHLPDHDALWLLRNARLPKQTRIILISACVEPSAIAQLRTLGVDHVIEKPLDSEQLLDVLNESVADARQRPDQGNRKKGGDPNSSAVTPGTDDATRRPHRIFGAVAGHAA